MTGPAAITRSTFLPAGPRGDYIVRAADGTHVGLACKRDDGWQSWLFQPKRNVNLGTFGTRRDAAAEIFIELSGGTWQ